MLKNTILIISILIGSYFGYSQNLNYNKNKIMLKLNQSNKNLAQGKTINHAVFNSFIESQNSSSLELSFPKHKSPIKSTNQYGDSLVDLTLWYTLNLQTDIPDDKLISILQDMSIFRYVEFRGISKEFHTPTDPLIGNQYYLDNIRAYDAWDIEQGDTNIVVAITDTGIDKLQEDLIDGIKYNYNDPIDGIDNDNDGFIDNFCGWDVGSNDNNAQWGTAGHGTFVSGFVSGVHDNNVGIAGVGYKTKILPVRIDNATGALSADYEGIVYSADHGASIINCSWGGPFGGNFGRDVVNYASHNKGALIIAACGNSNNPYWLYPASYENVLSCAATDTFDVRWANSSYGTTVDLSAPGTYVYSTWVNNAYFSSHGTSFSAPIIAGGAALVKSHFPNFTNIQIAEQLRVTADIIDTIPENSSTIGMMGAGRMNIYRALTDTLKPSVRFINQQIQISNDTLYISGDFINYLYMSSPSLMVNLACTSPYLIPIDDFETLGTLNTYSSINNNNSPMRYKISQNTPVGTFAEIQLNYSDTAYQGFEWIRVYLNTQTAIIDTNNITTSVNSISTLGFNDYSKMIGSGFSYKNGKNTLFWGGLIVASSNSKVSDNIGYSSDFRALSGAELINDPSRADLVYKNTYDDDSAGFSKNNIKVEQISYAFNNEPLKDIIFLEYNIINTDFNNLSDINVAFYADWDIEISIRNKCDYDSIENIAFSWSLDGGNYTGIQLMSKGPSSCYNFNNDGSQASINTYDGFLSFEKWDAMHTSRHIAGDTTVGTDISSMLTSNSHSIASNDTLKVTFAILAGRNKNEIIESAKAANYWFYNTASIDYNAENLGVKLLQNKPNPANDYTQIVFELENTENIKLELFSIEGKLIKTLAIGKYNKGQNSINLNLSNYESGIYTYVLSTSKVVLSRKLIINK